MTLRKPSRTRSLCASILALVVALAACGGGVETGGTGAGAYVQGPINGFGSVIVAGVRFDDAAAQIDDPDGNVRRREDLRLGMQVEVESGPITGDGSGNRLATATRVRLASELLGPVTSTDPANARITVLGQPVRLTPATVMAGLAAGPAALQTGDVVEVFGFFAEVNGYVATRVERRSSVPASYRVRGVARNLDSSGKTVRIGVDTFDLSVTGVPAGLANGQFVRLALQTTQTGGRWVASAITLDTRSLGERGDAEVEGLITAIASPAQFSVNGVAVNALAIAAVPGLAEGVRVDVRGHSTAGVLVASSVTIRSDIQVFDEGFDIRAVIDSVDAAAQTFTLRGITVFYGTQPPPRFDNGAAANLAAGVKVRVRGTLAPDRTRVVATRIEFGNN